MPSETEPNRARHDDRWGVIVERAVAGDRRAYAQLVRLVTGHLAHWRAYDFRPDWDDIVQDVLVSAVAAHREGRLSEPGALYAYLRQATRFKFIDRIRAAGRHASGGDPDASPERAEIATHWPPNASLGARAAELRLTLREALDVLPERERLSVYEVHVRGRTYEEAAEATGIPLGSLKRALRGGLARLREVLDEAR